MIQLAWRFLMFQKESALALWYRARTADSRSGTRKTMIVALARKLVIALWRLVDNGGRHPAPGWLTARKNIPLPTRRSRWLFSRLPIDNPRWRDAVFEHGTDAD